LDILRLLNVEVVSATHAQRMCGIQKQFFPQQKQNFHVTCSENFCSRRLTLDVNNVCQMEVELLAVIMDSNIVKE